MWLSLNIQFYYYIADLEFYVGLPLTEQHRAARVRGHGFSVVFEILFAPIELLSTLVAYTKSTTFTEINSVRMRM